MDHNIKTELTDDGILIARVDMPGRTMNVFSLDMMDSLERLLQHVEENKAVRAVVLTSGKDAFFAGADLDMVRDFTDRARVETHDQLHALCGHLGRLFRRLEKSPKPYVVAINGLALGGGFEISLACHARVVADGRDVLLGLPEVKLGLLPGAGGTQRLPRMVGTLEGMRLLLVGSALTPQQALDLGLVDQVVKSDELLDAALARARTLGSPVAPWDKPGAKFDSAPFDFTRDDANQQIAEAFGLTAYQMEKYPAYKAIMDCVVTGWDMPMDEAGTWEMDVFVRLIQDPVAGNMVRSLFLNRQRADKLTSNALEARSTRVAIVGGDNVQVQRLLETSRARIVAESELGNWDIALAMPGAKARRGISVTWATGTDDLPGNSVATTVWLSESSGLGRVIEINVPNENSLATDAGLVLARWLRATPLITSGSRLLLPRLLAARTAAREAGCGEDEVLLAVSLAAAEAWSEGGITDVDLADVGVVIAGLYPSYTGGPFSYIRQCGLRDIQARVAASARDAGLFRVPATLATLVEKISAPAQS